MYGLKNKDVLFLLSSIIVFVLAVISIPVYDSTNGLHNIFFDSYKIVWSDGRSPANFYLIRNLIQGKGISFTPDFVFRDTPAKDNYDFYEFNGRYFPIFGLQPDYLFSLILKPFNFLMTSDLAIYKAISFLVLIFYSISLCIFYFLQRMLGLNEKFSFFSTSVAGLATSIFIYSHYFFLQELLFFISFLSLLLLIFKFWNKKSIKASYLIPICLSFFIFLFSYSLQTALFFSAVTFYFCYYYAKNLRSWKIFVVTLFIAQILILLYYHLNFDGPYAAFANIHNSSYQIFKIFPSYLQANDFLLYGYHGVLNQRSFAFIYGFNDTIGNATFVHSIGPFAALFGEKGFVYNSIFLIFSILGIFLYKDVKRRNLLLAFLIIMLAFLSFTWEWYGGVTPRYVRNFESPILLLTFFSFYFMQENKNKLISLAFIFFVLVSFLNVVSLAVRTDWTYEVNSQLVSYDLLLWPFLPSNFQGSVSAPRT